MPVRSPNNSAICGPVSSSPGQLQLGSAVFVGVGERQCGEGADVVDGDHLQRGVGAQCLA
jgi:hypothetical protein